MSSLLWAKTAKCFAELLQLIPDQRLLSGGEAVARHGHRGAIDQLRRAALQVFLDGGPQTQHHPRQLVKPAGARQSSLEGVLEAAVKPLHKAVGLWVILPGGGEAYPQQRGHLRPEGGGELCTSVGGHQERHTEPGHPVVEQVGGDGGGGDVCRGISSGQQVYLSTMVSR